MEYRFVICDDERMHRENLKRHLEGFFKDKEDSYETIETSGGEELLKHDDLLSVDIAFLDIELEDMKGVDLSRKLKEINDNVLIIFVSSHPGYVEDSYEQRVFDFITKPIKDKRFIRVMGDALEAIEEQRDEKYFRVVNKTETVLAQYKDILYFTKDSNDLVIVLENDTIKIRKNLKDVETEIDMDYFLKCHNGYIVNKKRILKIKNNKLSLAGCKDKIDVSKKYLDDVLDAISDMIEGQA